MTPLLRRIHQIPAINGPEPSEAQFGSLHTTSDTKRRRRQQHLNPPNRQHYRYAVFCSCSSSSLAENLRTGFSSYPQDSGHRSATKLETGKGACVRAIRLATMEDSLRGIRTTLTTSVLPSTPTLQSLSEDAQRGLQSLLAVANANANANAMANAPSQIAPSQDDIRVQRSSDSTVNGVVIGLLSSFGSALLIALIFLIIYFFRYTSSGRILLDRIGRPGEYDDEQAYAREEAEALEEMDDLQRTEYLRAKGMRSLPNSMSLVARCWYGQILMWMLQ